MSTLRNYNAESLNTAEPTMLSFNWLKKTVERRFQFAQIRYWTKKNVACWGGSSFFWKKNCWINFFSVYHYKSDGHGSKKKILVQQHYLILWSGKRRFILLKKTFVNQFGLLYFRTRPWFTAVRYYTIGWHFIFYYNYYYYYEILDETEKGCFWFLWPFF